MTSRTIVSSSGKTLTGCSKLMIASMIHFSHICDTRGVITDFKASELALVLRCTLKSAYNVLDGLKERGLVVISDEDFSCGTRTIVLAGNDFSHVADMKDKSSLRYLNTNYPFFNYRENTGYDKFMDLSLFSMRLLLLLLNQYSKQNGYRVSFDTLCKQLGIKKRRYIHKYIKELHSFLPEDMLTEKSNPTKRMKYGSVSIRSYHPSMIPDYELTRTQDTYYARKWVVELKKAGFSAINGAGSLHYIGGRICAIVIDFLKEGILTLGFIENSIRTILSDHQLADDSTFTDIYRYLRAVS